MNRAGPISILSTGRDITERKHTMEALQYSENRYRTLINQAANALFVHDFSGKLLEVNQRACDSLGYTHDELLSLRITDIEQDFTPYQCTEGMGQSSARQTVYIDRPPETKRWNDLSCGNPFCLFRYPRATSLYGLGE